MGPFIAPTEWRGPDFAIRAYRIGDGAELANAVTESYKHLRPWMPWAREDTTPELAEMTARRLIARYLLHEDFTLGIWRGDRLIGGTGFHLRVGPLEERCAEIGMWIRAGDAGKGLGTQVLKAMLDWGFNEWGWRRLVWCCDTRNVASSRVAEKCGLTLEGTFRKNAVAADGNYRNTHVYAILSTEWPRQA